MDEVEGLKGGNEVYQQSILGTIENLKNTPPHTALDVPSSSTASGYYTGTNQSNCSNRQVGPIKIYDEMRSHTSHRISPIEEDAATPTPQNMARSAPVDTPPLLQSGPPMTANSMGNASTKTDKAGGNKRESNSSIFPKISRWSETTTSSGVRGFLRKGKPGKESEASMSNSEFDFWAESGHAGQQPDQFGETPGPAETVLSPAPPSSRGTDAPAHKASIRSSLEVKHPQPKQVYRHQFEQQAQQFINMEPSYNNTNTSLARYAGSQDGITMPTSPTSEGYTASMADSQLPARPPKILEEYEGDSSPTPLKEKKSKERNKDKTHRKDRTPKEGAELKDKETRRRERQERRERRERREREKENGGDRSHRSSKSKLTEETGAYLASDVDQVRPLFHKQSEFQTLPVAAGTAAMQYDDYNSYTDYDDYRSSEGGQSRDGQKKHGYGSHEEENDEEKSHVSSYNTNYNEGGSRVWFR